MFRRCLRIFCVVGLVLLLGMTLVGQLWQLNLCMRVATIGVNDSGAFGVFEGTLKTLNTLPPLKQYEWHARREGAWYVNNLFQPPEWNVIRDRPTSIVLPWWLLLATWGLLTALICFLTRRRKVSHPFPIEPAKSP